MPTVRVLIGTVACGKSTLARALASLGSVIVNDDAIVLAVHGGQYGLYDEALKPLYKSMEAHAAQMALALGRDAVIDRGVNLTARSRRRWIALAHALDHECEAVVFPFEEARVHALRRCGDDPRGHDFRYWERVAQAHIARYEEPSCTEGFSRVVASCAAREEAESHLSRLSDNERWMREALIEGGAA